MTDIETLRRILATHRVIAVVGLSAQWHRPSYFAAKYMKEHGYRIIPINPSYPVILDEPCYPSLQALPEELAASVGIVDCFRRTEDILPIARALLGSATGPGATRLSAVAEDALLAYAWPGNVRELQNRLQRARLVARGAEIQPDDLGLAPEAAAGGRSARNDGESGERQALAELLRVHGGSVSRAAGALGLSRQALYRRMERLGVTLERRPRG